MGIRDRDETEYPGPMTQCIRRNSEDMTEMFDWKLLAVHKLKTVPVHVEGTMRRRTRAICQDDARAQRWEQDGTSF